MATIDLTSRVPAASAAAQHAFWSAVATEFPEILTDDLPPHEARDFGNAMNAAVTAWVATNAPWSDLGRKAHHRPGARLASPEENLEPDDRNTLRQGPR